MQLPTTNKTTSYAIIMLSLLIALIFIAFQDVPENGFQFDDMRNIVNNKPTRLQHFSFSGIWQAGINALLPSRPIPGMSFAIDWLRGDGNPRPFLWTNLFIHTANALLVACFLSILLKTQAPDRKRTFLWFIPVFLATAIWAIHPIQIQTVTYIVQRMASMATLFSLLSILSYVMGRQATPNRWPLFLMSGLFFTIAMACKENAAITPVLIIMAEFGICRHGKPLINNRWDYVLLILPGLLAAFILIDVISGIGPISYWVTPQYSVRDFTLHERLLTQPRVIFFYLSQVLWPLPGRFSIEHDFATSTTLLTPITTIISIGGIVAWISGALWLLLRYPSTRVWGFCLLWIPATLAIESSFLPLEMVFEHRMYFPLVGLAGLLALALQSAIKYGYKIFTLPVLISCGMLLFCLSSTLQRVPDWKSMITLYESALKNAPGKVRLWANLGSEYFKAEQYNRSFEMTKTALKLDPNNLQALETFGSLLLREGRVAEAERYLQKAVNLGDNTDALANQLGFLAIRKGDLMRAKHYFLQAAEHMPWNPPYIWNAALALERIHDCNEARKYWNHYLSLDISNEERLQVQNRLQQQFDSPNGFCGNNSISSPRSN
jgi:hypothetical protein